MPAMLHKITIGTNIGASAEIINTPPIIKISVNMENDAPSGSAL